MSYTPTTWATGDVITAEKLNNMEDGIVAGQELFIIHATGLATDPSTITNPILDKTYEEIVNAIQAGKIPVLIANRLYDGANASSLLSFANFIGEPVNIIGFSFTSFHRADSSYVLFTVSVAINQLDGQTECTSTYDETELPIS